MTVFLELLVTVRHTEIAAVYRIQYDDSKRSPFGFGHATTADAAADQYNKIASRGDDNSFGAAGCCTAHRFCGSLLDSVDCTMLGLNRSRSIRRKTVQRCLRDQSKKK